jgi:hypothetical protein
MPHTDLRNGKSRNDPSPQELSNTTETLSNIFYLIEQTADDPKSIRELLKMAEGPMETLRDLASRRPVVQEEKEAPQEHHRLPLNEPAADHADPMPLATAGDDSPTSGAEAPPETRVDRLEAD